MNIIKVAASNRVSSACHLFVLSLTYSLTHQESVNNVASEDVAAGSAVAQEGCTNPCVLLLYPLNKNANILGNYHESEGLKPFPTIFWMCCPLLQARVAKLEEEGCCLTRSLSCLLTHLLTHRLGKKIK